MHRGRAPSRLGSTLALVALAGVGCRTSPAEAPPPDAASDWPESPFESSMDEPDEPIAAAVPEPDRPRPPKTIFRDEVERVTGPGPAYLLRQLGPEPFRHDGHFVGWEITRLFPDDPELCTPCDLALGDVILGVNGHRMQTPQELSDALEELPRWSELQVQSLRNGQRRVVTYAIVDDSG